MSKGYIQLNRSHETYELLKDPDAFDLLSTIALRAKRTGDFNVHNLQVGQALIGDYENCGLTERRYRTAKQKLQKWGLATFKGTNKGTIATILDEGIYNINIKDNDEQGDESKTDRRQASDEQATTNKNDKNYKNETTTKNRDVDDDYLSSIPDELRRRFANTESLIEYANNCDLNIQRMKSYLDYADKQKADNPVGLAITMARDKQVIPEECDIIKKTAEHKRQQLKREQEQTRTNYSNWILEAPLDDLVKHLNNPRMNWLIKELRPEVVECTKVSI